MYEIAHIKSTLIQLSLGLHSDSSEKYGKVTHFEMMLFQRFQSHISQNFDCNQK